MSLDVKAVVVAVLKFIGWFVFKEEYTKERKRRVDNLNSEYIEKIQKEMYKDE